jgi:hypothetical protein
MVLAGDRDWIDFDTKLAATNAQLAEQFPKGDKSVNLLFQHFLHYSFEAIFY